MTDPAKTPRQTKDTVPAGTEVCGWCYGSGTYYGRGIIENGVFKGFSGPCYRCNGKGYQTKKDEKRNDYYDNHVRRFEP